MGRAPPHPGRASSGPATLPPPGPGRAGPCRGPTHPGEQPRLHGTGPALPAARGPGRKGRARGGITGGQCPNRAGKRQPRASASCLPGKSTNVRGLCPKQETEESRNFMRIEGESPLGNAPVEFSLLGFRAGTLLLSKLPATCCPVLAPLAAALGRHSLPEPHSALNLPFYPKIQKFRLVRPLVPFRSRAAWAPKQTRCPKSVETLVPISMTLTPVSSPIKLLVKA